MTFPVGELQGAKCNIGYGVTECMFLVLIAGALKLRISHVHYT